MRHLKEQGLSYQSIGAVFGISRQRVHQILSGYQRLNRSLHDPDGWYYKLHLLVLERDNSQCQRCESIEALLVHHLDLDDRNNKLDNLITLCSTCHLELHRPKD